MLRLFFGTGLGRKQLAATTKKRLLARNQPIASLDPRPPLSAPLIPLPMIRSRYGGVAEPGVGAEERAEQAEWINLGLRKTTTCRTQQKTKKKRVYASALGVPRPRSPGHRQSSECGR